MRARAAMAILLVCLAAGCGHAPAAHAIDPALAACVPPGSQWIAGIDVKTLRASPLTAKLPASASAVLAQLDGVTSALAAYENGEALIAERGSFTAAPAGASLIAPGLALIGSPERVAAAAAQYKTRHSGEPALIDRAESIAAGAQLWIAGRGDASLPLSGNASEMAQIFRKASFVTLAMGTGAAVTIELRAEAPDSRSARAIEETLRADLTLAAAGQARHPDVAAVLEAAQVTRDDRRVELRLTAGNDAAARLLGIF